MVRIGFPQQHRLQKRRSPRQIGLNISKPLNFDEFFTFADALRNTKLETSAGMQVIPVDAQGYPAVAIPYNSGGTDYKLAAVTGINTNRDYTTDLIAGGDQFYLEITGGNAEIRVPGVGGGFITHTTSGFIGVPPNTEEVNVIINQADLGARWALYRPGETIGDVFESNLLTDLLGFKCLRGMDWTQTNNSEHFTWSDRILPGALGEGSNSRGASWETLIDLANLLNTDLWICIPHAADDNYIDNLAQLMQDNLNDNLTLYVEYSNECWNFASAFRDQLEHCYAVGMGVYGPGSGVNDITIVARGYGIECERTFQRFKHTYSKKARYMCCWQSAANSTHRMAINECVNEIDSVGTAPYLFIFSSNPLGHYQRDQDLDLTIQRIYDEALPLSEEWIQKYQDLIDDEYGSAFEHIMYEGGNHVTGYDDTFFGTVSAEDQETYAYSLVEREEFFDIYQKLDDIWERISGNTTRCYFNHGGKHRSGNAFAHKPFTGYEGPRWDVLRYLVENQ